MLAWHSKDTRKMVGLHKNQTSPLQVTRRKRRRRSVTCISAARRACTITPRSTAFYNSTKGIEMMFMAKTSSIEPYSYFICPSCVQKDLEHDDITFCPVHLEPGTWLDGQHLCDLCEEELLDDLTIRVHDRLLRGRLTWGDQHSISFALRAGGIHEVTLACPCEHGGVVEPFVYSFLTFTDYWVFIAALVEEHYLALKAIIG